MARCQKRVCELIADSVANFNPHAMTVEQLRRCIHLCNLHIRRSHEQAFAHTMYLNNWRSDRLRFERALVQKVGL